MLFRSNLLFDERNGITTHTLATSSSSAFLYDGTEESISNPQTGEHTLAALAQKTITTGEGEATANVVALGNPCRVLREINERDREYYYKDLKIDL